MLGWFQSSPGLVYWQAVKWNLQVPSQDLTLCVSYHNRDFRLTGFSTVDWTNVKDKWNATIGDVFLSRGGPILFCSKKQSCIALSTVEPKYVACTAAVQGKVWLRRFFQCLHITVGVIEAVVAYIVIVWLLCIYLQCRYCGRTKHVDIKYHYTWDVTAQGEADLKHISIILINGMLFPGYVKSLGLFRIWSCLNLLCMDLYHYFMQWLCSNDVVRMIESTWIEKITQG